MVKLGSVVVMNFLVVGISVFSAKSVTAWSSVVLLVVVVLVEVVVVVVTTGLQEFVTVNFPFLHFAMFSFSLRSK